MSIQHIEQFTPAETAKISGLGVVLQRDHRRRFPEWLPQRSGHARFNLFQCLQMRFVADAAELGINPSQAYPTGEWIAHSALFFALREPGCIIGDLGNEWSAPDPSAREIRDYTVRRVVSEAFGRPRIQELTWAIAFSDGSDWFGNSLDGFFDDLAPNDARSGKPVIAIHLPSFARRVVAKLPRAAVHIVEAEAGD